VSPPPDKKLVVKRQFEGTDFYPVIGDVSLWLKNGVWTGQLRIYGTGKTYPVFEKTEKP